jgi:sodium-coupled neutral amino acid transporter 11
VPVLSLLVNRQFVIFLATVTASYPLSLHRDISKLSKASGIGASRFYWLIYCEGPTDRPVSSVALLGMLVIVCSVLIEGSRVSPEMMGADSERFTIIRPRVFEAIGVISFAFVSLLLLLSRK